MPFYVASGRRDTTPEQEIDYLKTLVEPTGAKALKFRVGGRMSRNEDAMPGRTDKLIPLVRKVFGDKMVIHADANSSYDPPKAIEVGRMLEDVGAIHYEEPCPFDNFDDTKKVTDALKIPIAFGEQESSHWRFQWCIRNHVVDIVQPDLYYYGGMIRSRRVARMAEQAGHGHHRSSLRRIWICLFAALCLLHAENRSVAGIQKGRGNLRPMVRPAAENCGWRHHRAARSGRGHRRSEGNFERRNRRAGRRRAALRFVGLENAPIISGSS